MKKRLPTAKNAMKAAALSVTVAKPEVFEVGCVDLYGYVEGVAGWFFIGWTHLPASSGRVEDCVVIARFDRGGVGGKSNVVFFQRPDLGGRGIGVIAFLQGTGRVSGDLVDLRFQFGDQALNARTRDATRRLAGQELLRNIRPILFVSALADATVLF